MLGIFGGPRRYVQGPGAIDELGSIRSWLAQRPLAIVDADVLPLIEAQLTRALGGGEFRVLQFSGEVTFAAIERLEAQLEGFSPDAVVGIGGGKTLDAAKGVTKRVGASYVAVPSIASNDSPTGRTMAIYDNNHVMVAVDSLSDNPALVVVDTQLIANAPARFLRSGIGDAIGKKFEAERAKANGSRNAFGGRPLLTAMAIADMAYRTLREHGVAAMAAAEAHVPDEAFEAVVEANVLMSGLAWESGGLSYAHAVVRGLVQARDAKTMPHGEHVAYGTLVQLAIDGADDETIRDLAGFLRHVGLPASLANLGMNDATDAEITEIARLTTIGPENGLIDVLASAEDIKSAILRVEGLA